MLTQKKSKPAARNCASKKASASTGIAKRGQPATCKDVLTPGASRRRVASPVTAPLVYRRPAQTELPAAESLEERASLEAKLVKRKREDELWKAYHKTGSAAARNALWVYYQTLVRYIAERLKAKLPECIDVHDLMGAGHLGLQDAIAKFDTRVGVRFETYCVPRIRGAMLDSIRACDWVPRLIRNKNHQFERLVRELAAQLGREPREEEIAKKLNVDLSKLGELRKELDVKAQISLESGASENADERDLLRLEMLEGRGEPEPSRELQREEIRDLALRGLHPNERVVVEQYYFQGRSMKQIGEDLALSESRICQIHAQVLEVLKLKFRAYKDSCSF